MVATQISNVMAAIKAKLKRFVFEGQEIRLIPSLAIFVTMNPGYAGALATLPYPTLAQMYRMPQMPTASANDKGYKKIANP